MSLQPGNYLHMKIRMISLVRMITKVSVRFVREDSKRMETWWHPPLAMRKFWINLRLLLALLACWGAEKGPLDWGVGGGIRAFPSDTVDHWKEIRKPWKALQVRYSRQRLFKTIQTQAHILEYHRIRASMIGHVTCMS